MKIVIDIPEREFCLYGSMVKMDMGNEAVRFIAKGQPLDNTFEEIKAEIAGTEYHFIDGEAMVKVNKVFDIIEKKQEVV